MNSWQSRIAIGAIGLIAGCGGGRAGGSDTPPPPPPTYTIGGTVAGLKDSGFVVQNNGANDAAIAAGATSFVFAGAQTYRWRSPVR
jgi:hypothetical protein